MPSRNQGEVMRLREFIALIGAGDTGGRENGQVGQR
jgi:hypothetical protein